VVLCHGVNSRGLTICHEGNCRNLRGSSVPGVGSGCIVAYARATTGKTAHRHGFLIVSGLRKKSGRCFDFCLFVGLWGLSLITAYSFIRYKTPWLTLNFLVPLASVCGYAVAESFSVLRSRRRS
jgi:predicted membrane-bound mannosyltransferase